jgi:DNA-binding MarR family transcriptional regulator
MMATRKDRQADGRARRKERPGKALPLPRLEAAGNGSTTDLGTLPETIGYVLRRAQLAVFQDVTRAFAAFDMRPAQYSVLTIIGRNPGLTQTQVAEALGIQRANFVALLDGLEARGLARREPVASDRRSYALHLTPEGRDLLARLQQLEADHERRLVERIGPENRALLLDLLRRLAPNDDREALRRFQPEPDAA